MLGNYYRMCEQLVQAINENPDLIAVNRKRFDETTWPDAKHHILASDIIYCASNYTLFGNIELPKLDKKSVTEKAKQNRNRDLDAKLNKIQTDLNDIFEEKEMMDPIVLTGVTVQHKKFGNGVIIDHDNNVITVRFNLGDKKLGLPDAFINKSMVTELSGINNFTCHTIDKAHRRTRPVRLADNSRFVLQMIGQVLLFGISGVTRAKLRITH